MEPQGDAAAGLWGPGEEEREDAAAAGRRVAAPWLGPWLAPLPRPPSQFPPVARLRLGGWSRAGRGLRVALARRAGVMGQGGVELVVRGVPGGGRLDRDRSKLAGEGAPSAAKLLAGGRDGHAVAGVRHPPLVECVRRGVRRPCPPRRPPRLPGPASSSPSLRCPLSLTPAPASCLAPSAVPGPLGPRPDPLGLQLPSTPACLATTPVPLFSPR